MQHAGTITRTRTGESLWLVELSGEHDLSTAAGLRAELDHVLSDGASVVVDLSQVTFIDSSVVGVLLTAHRSAGDALGRALVIVAPPAGAPARLLAFIGAQSVLPVFESRADALASPAPAPGGVDGGV
jgi:anti-anti-sigma factor